MRSYLAFILSTTLAAQPAPKTDRTTKALKDVGELGKYGLPAAALLDTLIHGNREDTAAFLWSFGATAVETEALKRMASKQRPDFTDTDAFPSGHTAAAFSGALFIQDREGWAWGGPALGLAALTGYGRVRAGEHGWDDVIGGFGLALLNHYALASSQPGRRLWIAPWTAGDASGLQFGIRTDGASSIGGGTFLLWMADPQLERRDAPAPLLPSPERAPTAGMRLELDEGKGRWSLQAGPQTTQSYQVLSTPQAFAGQVLPAGVRLATQTVLMDLRSSYAWRLGGPEDGGSLALGPGLAFGSHEEAFALPDQPWIREQAQALLPILRAEGEWDPSPWIAVHASGETGSLSGSRLREAAGAIHFRLPRGYGLEAGLHDTTWTFRRDQAARSVRSHGVRLGLSLTW